MYILFLLQLGCLFYFAILFTLDFLIITKIPVPCCKMALPQTTQSGVCGVQITGLVFP